MKGYIRRQKRDLFGLTPKDYLLLEKEMGKLEWLLWASTIVGGLGAACRIIALFYA